MDAGDLLLGPRGRRLCQEFQQLAGASRPTLVDDRAAFQAVAEACAWAMYWQPPHDADVNLRSGPGLAGIRAAAEALASSPAMSWWSSPVDAGDQHLVVFDAAESAQEPQLTGLREAVDTLDAFHADSQPFEDSAGRALDWRTISGAWWSAPMANPGAHTARSFGQPPLPVGLVWVEDAFGWSTATSWQVRPASEVRVLELRGPQDWVEMVRRYPLEVTATAKRGDWWRTTGRDGRWAMPDWPAVADDWDAVHLTVAGYLTTAGRALPVDGDTATVLAGWPPDATFWLADVLEAVGGPARWRWDGDRWSPA
ncbi:MAG TPA: hypothetical protein VF612_03275 [Jatrophihabitans sp.]|uniref:hypothetical protein n=1 Tax=Jatrophihabitans sp. TaxID=1932789 RepID=UPI002F176CA4